MHACSSSYTRQQNERLVHARVQFPMVIRYRSIVRTRKMLRAFLKMCQAVQLLHACVVKFKVSGTVYQSLFLEAHGQMNQTLRNRFMGVLTSKLEPQFLSEINSNTQITYNS